MACLLLGAAAGDAGHAILALEAKRTVSAGGLETYLASRNASIAQRAALALGRTANPAAAPILAPYVRDPRSGVRALAIFGLGLLAQGTAADRLEVLVRADPSGAVRIAALDALGRYEAAKRLKGDAESAAFVAVRRALASDPNATVRGRAAISLNFFADGPLAQDGATALVAALGPDERSNYVRERVMWTIFRRYATLVPRDVLRVHLRDRDEVVRIEAARAYGHLKGAEAEADVKTALDDPSWRVQEQAAESLLALEGKPIDTAWTQIPAGIHTPAPVADPLAAEMPQPRPATSPAPPDPLTAALGPDLVVQTAEQMVSPARGLHPRLRIVTTQGNVYVALYPEWAPLTVANFLNLMNSGFYDDNRWFRIVPDFVVQTGEKDDKNAPGPGYAIGAEENPLEQNAYVISMGLDYDDKTNTPKRDSAGSEYYITLSPQYHLDSSFTVFGAVTGGFDVLGRLVQSDRVIRIERIGDVTL